MGMLLPAQAGMLLPAVEAKGLLQASPGQSVAMFATRRPGVVVAKQALKRALQLSAGACSAPLGLGCGCEIPGRRGGKKPAAALPWAFLHEPFGLKFISNGLNVFIHGQRPSPKRHYSLNPANR